jgi:hypothetical protein
MIEKKSKGEPLLAIGNIHTPDCGPPPSLDAEGKYLGYFENIHGEQWVFIGDPQSGNAVIRSGDAGGWATEHQVSRQNPCPNLFLGDSEKLWIITCFMAMANVPFEVMLADYNKAAKCWATAFVKYVRGEEPQRVGNEGLRAVNSEPRRRDEG